MRKILFLITASCLLIAAYAKQPDITTKIPGVLNVIAYSEFKPISYANGEGYEGDLLKAVAKLWGIKIKFYPEAFYDGIWRLPSKPYTIADISMGGITPTASRIKEGSSFTAATTCFSQSLLIRKADYQSGRIVSYGSFRNYHLKIGVVPGTTGERYAHVRAKEFNVPSQALVQYPSESELLQALVKGKIDAIARGEIGNEYQEKLNSNLVVIEKKNFNECFTFATDKSNKKLSKNLNKAIMQLTNNGKITYSQWKSNPRIFNERLQQIRAL